MLDDIGSSVYSGLSQFYFILKYKVAWTICSGNVTVYFHFVDLVRTAFRVQYTDPRGLILPISEIRE
jgi:hypothetical protein